MRVALLLASLATLLFTSTASGATTWAPADKQGFGTAPETRSRVWFTLGRGDMTEVYYPTLGTPSVRELDLAVNGRRVAGATRHRVERPDPRSLTFRQIDTERSGRWRVERTYVTDPARDTVMVDVRFVALSGGPYRVSVRLDPSLDNGATGDHGRAQGGTLLSADGRVAAALRASPALRGGRSATRKGDLTQRAETTLTGHGAHQHLTLALGFGRTTSAAAQQASGSLRAAFPSIAGAYAVGWHRHLDALRPAPAPAAALGDAYATSLMVLAASEDKSHRGAFVASPTMPWAWRLNEIEKPSGAYHLVWSRDQYQIATALLAAGDVAGAGRALDFLFARQQKRDGTFPQNSDVAGKPHWTKLQLDEVAFPIVLAWQLGRTDAATYADHIRPAAEAILRRGPQSEQERWENQAGWSPATIAAEIAGLVCAADLAARNGRAGDAARYLGVADAWQRSVEQWTATTTGPLSGRPYYLRVTKRRDPDRATPYKIGDSGPSQADQRRVVDPSFLELVRLGVKRWDDPTVRNTLAVVDDQLLVGTRTGTYWHRFSYDGYGERRDGGDWDIGKDDTYRTFGRAWPIFAGERGEYELLAGEDAAPRLLALAASANAAGLMPEQVWDDRAPATQAGVTPGEGTRSATPLAWTHAQFVRLAWSMAAGAPIERPAIVACRYAGACP